MEEQYTDSGEDKCIFSEDDNDYFTVSTRNNKTSKNTDSSPLDSKRFAQEISKVIPKHQNEKEKLLDSYYKQHRDHDNRKEIFVFNRMYNALSLGYSCLISGIGSKIDIVETFVDELCTDGPSIHFRGFLPNLSVKDLLLKITFSLFGIDKKFTSPIVHCNFIKSIFENKDPEKLRSFGGTFQNGVPDHLYIVVHNIDGYSLRNETSQITLALLSTIPQIHLIATIDCIDAQLLWDSKMLENFNWTTHSLPTFKSYDIELSYDLSSIGSGNNGGGKSGSNGGSGRDRSNPKLQPSTILTVLKSLTDTSTDIFQLLLKHLIEQKKKKIEFKVLYDICSDDFLVSSESFLKTQLREYIDHKIIIQKDVGDTTFLFVPIETSVMQIVLDQLENRNNNT